jgi:DNA polymerase-3 subunit chi
VTEVAFHFNVPDRLAYACRLIRKATGQGVRLVVLADGADAQRLDQLLWTFSAREFIAHCRLPAHEDMAAASPVLIGGEPGQWPHSQVMLNLGAQVPAGFERFERLIELVTGDEDDRHHARQRWRHYASRGYPIVRHDLSAQG